MDKKRVRHQPLYDCLGEVIAFRRKKLNMSQEQLAEESGVDRAFISNVEKGKRNPSFGVVASIAEGLRLRLSKLVVLTEECNKNRAG
ncbi:MAG: helix-turn-helix domain-containing protein [Candidatus Obscuribacterales bacterium]|jgi:UDPglucose 6-dehydrogenase|nr:helix-turn-helix domain-containing protein [Candidatus Obscuribacterales bacterium]